MPNWCYNGLHVHHADPKMIDKFVKGLSKGLFNTFIPYPEKYKKLDEKAKAHNKKTGEYIKDGFNQGGYEWCVENWGTKWDVFLDKGDIGIRDKNNLRFGFQSAWAPPVPFYDKLVELGFKVEADYEEGGAGFIGVYKEGQDKSCDFPTTIKEFNKLPKEFRATFEHLKESIILDEIEAKESQ